MTAAKTSLLGRVPPHNPDAELSVLGSLFVDGGRHLADLEPLLCARDFYSPAHQAVFQAACNLARSAAPVDLVTVADELERMGALDRAGGPVYLAELAGSAMSPAKGAHHARIVASLSARRKLITSALELADAGFDLTRELGAAAPILTEIDEALHGRAPADATVTPGRYLPEYMENLARLQEMGGLAGIPTPWDALNRFTAGFVPGEVTILAGRSGTGKTAMALNIAEHAAAAGHSVGVLSLEMTRDALTHRFMAAGAGVDAQKFRTASLKESDWARLYGYADKFSRLPIFLCDKRELRPSELRALCRQWKRENGLSLLIVDYLQLMKPEERDRVREREVAEISRSLKLMAVDLEIPVLVLAQLNREAEKEKRPRLGHLRESGAIEQDADIILFIVPWRVVGEDVPETAEVEVDVAKGRNNAVGTAKLMYRRKHLKFVNACQAAG